MGWTVLIRGPRRARKGWSVTAHHPDYHLAELNIALLRAPLDAPEIKEFVDFLDPVNAHAEQMPGFVWRLTAPDGQSSSYVESPFEDPLLITNMSVWTDLDSLRAFMYDTVHRYFLQNRRKWFERLERKPTVLWWVQAGHIPTLEEAVAQLNYLEQHGSTPSAFTLHEPFDPEGRPMERPGARAVREPA
jgi:hypothetical protein